ncbi:MAG: hypothetical protein AAFR16_14190 [Pseudomonadota bacterium]
MIAGFDDLLALIRARRDGALMFDVERYVRPGAVRRAAQGYGFDFTAAEGAPADLAARLRARLMEWTAVSWTVALVDGCDGPTVAESRAAAETDLRAQAEAHPLVQAALAAFPGAEVKKVRRLADLAAPDAADPMSAEGAYDDGFFEDPEEFLDD